MAYTQEDHDVYDQDDQVSMADALYDEWIDEMQAEQNGLPGAPIRKENYICPICHTPYSFEQHFPFCSESCEQDANPELPF